MASSFMAISYSTKMSMAINLKVMVIIIITSNPWPSFILQVFMPITQLMPNTKEIHQTVFEI